MKKQKYKQFILWTGILFIELIFIELYVVELNSVTIMAAILMTFLTIFLVAVVLPVIYALILYVITKLYGQKINYNKCFLYSIAYIGEEVIIAAFAIFLIPLKINAIVGPYLRIFVALCTTIFVLYVMNKEIKLKRSEIILLFVLLFFANNFIYYIE